MPTACRRTTNAASSRRCSCNTEPPANGEGQFTVANPKAYTGSSTVNTVVQGQPERMLVSTNGRWIGTDCGTLTPRQR